MLRELRIRDLGVIEDATLTLDPGLTVVTGETGAGKTMVVTGLGLVLGGRADASLVRSGRDDALVEAELELADDHPARDVAVEVGGIADDTLQGGIGDDLITGGAGGDLIQVSDPAWPVTREVCLAAVGAPDGR